MGLLPAPTRRQRHLRDVSARPRPTRHLCDTPTDAHARTTTDTCANCDARPNTSAGANTTTDRVALDQLLKQLSVLGAQAFDVIDGRPAEFSLVEATGPAEVGTSQVGIGEIRTEDAA